MTDSTNEMLRNQVLSIIRDLENPVDVDEDGTPVEELGWVWDDEADCYRDEDGDEVDENSYHPMTGYDYLRDVLDIEYVVNSKKEYLGASILVAFGGPNIRIDTRHSRVVGDWWGDHFEAPYRDAIGLDEACAELFAC